LCWSFSLSYNITLIITAVEKKKKLCKLSFHFFILSGFAYFNIFVQEIEIQEKVIHSFIFHRLSLAPQHHLQHGMADI